MCAPAVVLLHMMKDDRFIDRVATYKVLSILLLSYAIDSGQNIEGDIFSYLKAVAHPNAKLLPILTPGT